MPSKSPGYRPPVFNPDNSTDIGTAMGAWVDQFTKDYQSAQEESERLPMIVSTFTGDSVPNPRPSYLSKKVQMMGGEQVQVFGFFDFTVSAGGVLTTNSGSVGNETAVGKLSIIYPGGTKTTFGSQQQARLRVSLAGQGTSEGVVARTSVTNSAYVGFVWPVETKMQTGGEHVFILGTSGSGTVTGGQLTILVV